MAQYKIETLFSTQGSRTYYMEADDADTAVQDFNKELVKNNQADERIYAMTEDVKNVELIDDNERVDIDGLKKAQALEWEQKMNTILAKTRKKLKDTMGFGIPDDLQNLKS